MNQDIQFSETLLEKLLHARRVAVLTGAGISAESGVPTFRDPGGLWQQFRPEELANVRAFLRNPVLVQGWYLHRRAVVEQVQPNPGHVALARLEQRYEHFTLITQNVDNLHQRAGSKNVVELHGNLLRSFCIECRRPFSEREMAGVIDGDPARCPDCGGLIRPDVVWFGEMLPADAIDKAYQAAQAADVFLTVGTSAVVQPAASLPLVAAEYGAYVVEINVEPSAIAHQVDEILQGKAGEVLPRLVAELEDRGRTERNGH